MDFELTKRQKEIINASLEIISQQGMQNLTMKTLAQRINVTDGAIYRHFKSKEEIITAIADLFKLYSTETLNQILSTPQLGIQKVEEFFLGRCRLFSENKGFVLIMFPDEAFTGFEPLQRKIRETMHAHKEMLIQAFNEGQQEGIIRDIESEHLFMVVMGALRLLITRWKASGFAFDLTTEGSKLWNSLEKLLVIEK